MKKYILLSLKILISFGLFYYLFNLININYLFKYYSKVNIVFLSIPFLILFFQYTLSALKWRLILVADNISIRFLFLIRSYLIGNFLSLFLPTSFGGDVYRAYSLKKHNCNVGQNVSSVLFDRLSGLFTLMSIAILSYACFLKKIVDYRFLTAYFLIMLLFWFLVSERSIAFLDGLNSRLLSFINSILKSLNKYKNNKAILLKVILVSFMFHNNVIWLVKLYCIAMNVDISIKHLYMIVPLIYLIEALPISINGWGVREGAFVYFFLQIGKTAEEAVAVSLLLIAMRYFFSMSIGGSLFFTTIFWAKKRNNILYGNQNSAISILRRKTKTFYKMLSFSKSIVSRKS